MGGGGFAFAINSEVLDVEAMLLKYSKEERHISLSHSHGRNASSLWRPVQRGSMESLNNLRVW